MILAIPKPPTNNENPLIIGDTRRNRSPLPIYNSRMVYVGNTLHCKDRDIWKDETGSNPVLTTKKVIKKLESVLTEEVFITNINKQNNKVL